MEAEYGSVNGLRFIQPSNVKMYDSEGKVVLCKCGNPAGCSAMGKESYIAWCSDCSPLSKEVANFVYNVPQ